VKGSRRKLLYRVFNHRDTELGKAMWLPYASNKLCLPMLSATLIHRSRNQNPKWFTLQTTD
jgi:hypothetical protein